MIWMLLWIASIVATFIIASRNQLKNPVFLALGNVILPGIGLLYVLYIIYIYIPRREGRIPPVLVFIRVFFEELSKDIKKYFSKTKR